VKLAVRKKQEQLFSEVVKFAVRKSKNSFFNSERFTFAR